MDTDRPHSDQSPPRLATLNRISFRIFSFRNLFRPGAATQLGASLQSWLPGLLVGAAYVTYLLTVFEPGSVFEYDPDEGYTLMKTAVLSKGFHYYRDIWSDQPPLFSYILWAVFTQFGWKVLVARVVVTVFVGAGMFAIYDTLRRSLPGVQGHLAGLIACVFLAYSNYFNELSVSAMVGMPAVFAMTGAAWSLVIFHRNMKKRWLIASGIFMGVSIGIKLFAAFLLPAFFAFACFASLMHYKQQTPTFDFRGALRHAVARVAILFAALMAFAALAFLPALLTESSSTLWAGHWSLRNANASLKGGIDMLYTFINDDPLMFFMAIPGAWRALLRRNVAVGLFGVWLVCAVVVLADYYPIWVHHRVLLTIPAAVLAGYGISELVLPLENGIPSKRWRLLAVVPVALLLAVIPLTDARVRDSLKPATSWADQAEEEKVQQLIDKYGKSGEYMVTSRQMYAFRAGMPVPPNLAETSVKRFMANFIDAKTILKSIRKYRPRIVVLSRRWPHPVRQAIVKNIKAKYRLVLLRPQGRKTEVWVRR